MTECAYQHCVLDGANVIEVAAHDVAAIVGVCNQHKEHLEQGYPIALFFHLKPTTGGSS